MARFEDILSGRVPVMDEGHTILRYVRSTGRVACDGYAFVVKVAGTMKALCLLTPTFGSIAMEEGARERGCEIVLCANRCKDGLYTISLYAPFGRPRVHLGEYLRHFYHGGGHECAAGCVVDEKTFIRLLNKKEFWWRRERSLPILPPERTP